MDPNLPASRPRVLVSPCLNHRDGHPGYWIDGKYIDAVRLAGAEPWLVPDCHPDDLPELLGRADGLLLTGSPSNVHPAHFGQSPLDPDQPLDPARDAWTLRAVPLALSLGVPLLGICRGLQEINVALGGSLHQDLRQRPGSHTHLTEASDDADALYEPAHPVALAPGGVLQQWLQCSQLEVNSIHQQGIGRLAPGLRVEATAPDGLVEAVSAPDAPAFAVAVQWHPEWRTAGNRHSLALWRAFGAACQQRQQQRPAPNPSNAPWSTRNN